MTSTESSPPWQNQAEGQGVKKIKKLGFWLMQKYNVSMCLWDFAFELASSIISLTCVPHLLFGEQTDYQIITQIKPDISQYASFHFIFRCGTGMTSRYKKSVRKWLGVDTVRSVVTIWILPIFGIPIPHLTVIKSNPGVLIDFNVKELLNDYISTITSKMGKICKYLVPLDPSATPPRKIEQSHTVSDVWDGDINMIPYVPISEECAMEQLDELIGS